MYYQLILLVAILFFAGSANAQEISLADIDFSNDQEELPLAFAGGLRAPQFNTADLNLDGLEDLVIYERDGKVIIPLIRKEDGGLRFDPSFRAIFPKIPSWMLLRDFDNDGIKDLFCSPVNIGIPGVEVYRGQIIEGQLRYELVTFPKEDFDILVVPIGNIETQIYVSVIDMPDIRDMDGDGDLDIIAFEPSGSTIYLYRNLAMEMNFSLDSLIFELDENCYGGFVESGFSQEVSLSPVAGECASFFWQKEELSASSRHSGSTVLSIDVAGDTLPDILLGDISYDGLVMLTNTGTASTAHFTEQETRFPAGPQPVDIELFVAPFYEDVDGDGAAELIAVPNDRFSSQTTGHIWIYDRSLSPGNETQFTLRDKDFLVNEMINPGPNTAPVFMDYNSDGFMDLVVGTNGLSTDGIEINPRLVLYEHSGDIDNPSFRLVNDDYLGMAAFRTTSRHFAPAIGDLDGDGDLDMVIGDNTGRLYYLENKSDDPKVFTFDPPVYNAFDIKVSAWARPAIYDYNNDGLGDLIIGEQNFNSFNGKRGSLNYFQNSGTIGNPAFDPNETATPNDPIFGRINLKEPGFISNYSSPVLFQMEDKLLLATGSAQGFIQFYETSSVTPSDSFSLRTNAYGNIREGENSSVTFADVNNDNYLEMAVGTRRGGIAIYHTDLFMDVSSDTDDLLDNSRIHIFPNPASDQLSIELNTSDQRPSYWAIYNVRGQRVLSDSALTDDLIDIRDLETGVYILELRLEEGIVTKQFVKL